MGLFPLAQESYRAPGDYPTCGELGIPWFFVAGKHRQTYSTEDAVREVNTMDPIVNMRSLNAEINNGRLAMFSIAGMVAQNAFIGTTGPDMWIPRPREAGCIGFISQSRKTCDLLSLLIF